MDQEIVDDVDRAALTEAALVRIATYERLVTDGPRLAALRTSPSVLACPGTLLARVSALPRNELAAVLASVRANAERFEELLRAQATKGDERFILAFVALLEGRRTSAERRAVALRTLATIVPEEGLTPKARETMCCWHERRLTPTEERAWSFTDVVIDCLEAMLGAAD